MEDMNISISYDLEGLYDTDFEYIPLIPKEERKELLRIANRAKELGLANVRKGIYVTIREKIENVIDKIVNFKNLLLPKGRNIEEDDEDERAEGEDVRVDEEEKTGHQKFMEKFKAKVNHKKARENAEEELEERELEEEAK